MASTSDANVPPPAGPPAPKIPFPRTFYPLINNAPVFNMRDGLAESASSLLVRPTIDSAYHWRPIGNLPPAQALGLVDAFIGTQKAILMSHRPKGMTDVQLKKAAIVLGVSRAVATAYYGIAAGELMPGERGMAYIDYIPPAGPDLPPELVLADWAPEDVKAVLLQELELDEADRAAMTVLLRCTLGTIPLQGYSLLLTNHHYLSDPGSQSRKAFAAVEKQFWKEPAIAEWVESDKEMIQDLLWHKACHPVNMTIKLRAATSEVVREQLVTAGVGSAAARLPALEPEARSGSAYVALFDVVRPMFSMYSGSVTYDVLDLAINTLKAYPPGVDNPVQPSPRDARIPANVVNRRTATIWLSAIVKRNSAAAAHCYGFYAAMSERSMLTGTSTGLDTLRNSFALRKLVQTNMPSYHAGFEQYADYMTARAKARADGVFEAPVFVIE